MQYTFNWDIIFSQKTAHLPLLAYLKRRGSWVKIARKDCLLASRKISSNPKIVLQDAFYVYDILNVLNNMEYMCDL